MTFTSPLIHGILIKRYKRFLADIALDNGDIVTAHCPNTGAMTGCAEPDFDVWLSKSDNPKRRLSFSWELAVDNAGNWIGINTHRANAVFAEALESGSLLPFTDYTEMRKEVKYGEENSRIDFKLSASDMPDCYIEVKSVTLLENDQGYFPDTKTQRGAKHLRELITMVQQGHRAVLAFVVQHTGIKSVKPADHLDPLYAELFAEAVSAGVEVFAWGCSIDKEKIELDQALSVVC